MSKNIKITTEVEIPKIPNFLRMSNGQTIPVSAVSEDSLRELGKLWVEALVKRAREHE